MWRKGYKVVQYFINDAGHEVYCEGVSAQKALEAFNFLTTNVAAKIGTTHYVELVDCYTDHLILYWKFGHDVVFCQKD